jgi:Tol biopolymer transport system component
MATGTYILPRISPDGKRAALQVDDGKDTFIAVYDLAGTAPIRRLTFGGKNTYPLWTRDGQRIIFQSDREGDQGLFWQRADGSGSSERLTTAEKGDVHIAEAVSPDGKFVLVSTNNGISTLPLEGGRTLQVLLPKPSTGAIRYGAFSPDGHWLVYVSTETSTSQVYVQPVPPTGAKYQITNLPRGATRPLWSPDGKQIFYMLGGTVPSIVSVDVQTQPAFVIGKSTPLPIDNFIQIGGERGYDITPDGKQFLALFPPGQSQSGDASLQINTVLNWFEDLKQRVPVK